MHAATSAGEKNRDNIAIFLIAAIIAIIAH